MISKDFISELFGKDVAHIIYSHVFKLRVQDLNREYKKDLKDDTKDGHIEFNSNTHSFRCVIQFNYREGPATFISAYAHTPQGWRFKYFFPRNGSPFKKEFIYNLS